MYYIGMMSGTSLDGIDVVLATYLSNKKLHWEVVCHVSLPLPKDLKETLYQLNFPNIHNDSGSMGELHTAKIAEQQITHSYAESYQQLIAKSGIDPQKVIAIGAHGQTIRHEPHAEFPYTVQLINGALLSYLTKQTIVCDFRSKDIAAGGQGAPLAPLFHRQLYSDTPSPFAVVNIGGIANISVIDDSATPTLVSGFDCGPGNCLMDEWIMRHQQQPYDHNGEWASEGRVISELLSSFLRDDYFSQPAPKSTGRDYFNPQWLHNYLSGDETPEDVMRTLVNLSAKVIVDELPINLQHLIIVGGGAKNKLLCEAISNFCHQRGGRNPTIVYGDSLAIDAQHVEALGFALLAKSCVDGESLPTSAVTGAQSPVICGAIYQK